MSSDSDSSRDRRRSAQSQPLLLPTTTSTSSSNNTTKPSTTSSDTSWGLLKKLLLLLSLAAFSFNIHATLRLGEIFAHEYAEDLKEFTKPIVIPENKLTDSLSNNNLLGSSSASSAASLLNNPASLMMQNGMINPLLANNGQPGNTNGVQQRNARPPNKVLKILQLFERTEKTLRPPEDLRRVVILGKSFIMKRDFGIWEFTFGEAGFVVSQTNKNELSHEPSDSWSVMLCLDLFDGKSHCIEPADLPTMRRWQKISRLIGLRKILWNKDRFCETMGSALKGFTNYTEFVFPCWILPHQFNDMIAEVKEKFTQSRFILKPTDRGEGNGIIVMDNYRKLAEWKAEFPDNEEVVVQTYLNNPMLIKDRKWDMRTYILITSIHPLRLYMYRDGLVRFASTKYDADAKDGGKKTAFLTNTSVNKKTGQSVEDLTWPYPQVYDYLKRHDGVDPDELWRRIERAVTQVLLSSEAAFLRRFKAIRNDYTCSNCYQLLGVDVIVDDNMIPRIIEVNGEPSMQLSGEINSHYDHTKKSMTHDLVKILFTTDSYARELTALLSELELDGWNIGYMSLNGCTATDDICLRSIDLQYLLDFVKEEYNMGGFRRLYPHKDGDMYTRFLIHLESKLPYGTLTSTLRLHKLVTTLAKMSTVKQNNDIADEAYFARQNLGGGGGVGAGVGGGGGGGGDAGSEDALEDEN
jgi:hypothetical protein